MDINEAIQNLRDAAYVLDQLKSRVDMVASRIELIDGTTCRVGDVAPNREYNEVCIDVSMHGDRRKLAEFWRTMRSMGYRPSSKPKKGETTYYAFWRTDATAFSKVAVWLSFTSTQCVRVHVGQRLMDVYETRCA